MNSTLLHRLATSTIRRLHFLFLLFFLNLITYGQCIEEQLLINGNNGPSPGWSLGQQFVACETGLIDEIEFSFTPGTQATTMKLEIYESSTGWANLIWTVDNITVSGPGLLLVNLGDGSGSSQEVTGGLTYSMRMWNVGSNFMFFDNYFSSTDMYPEGFTLNHFGNVENWSPNFMDRYFRIAINGAPLPVELIDFTANKKKSDIQLNWQTASEENNAGFDIQKSKNGRDWQSIGFVTGKGITSELQQYAFTDPQPYDGNNYYRLKQIDHNGKFEFSQVRHVLMTGLENTHLQIYPNPSPGHFTLRLHNPKREKANIKLFDSIGNLIWEQSFLETETNIFWEKDFDLPQREVYFVVSQVGDKVESQKVTIVSKL